MRETYADIAIPLARGLVGAASVDGGPTDQQLNIVSALLQAYWGLDADATMLEPMGPEELSQLVPEGGVALRMVQVMIVLEFCRHPATLEQAESVERYAAILGVDEPMLAVGRAAARSAQEAVAADWARFREPTRLEPALEGHQDEALASRLRDLGRCPEGSLGRAFFDFYRRYGLAFPGEPGGGDPTLVTHDFTHVVGGYEPLPVDEVALQAMLTSAASGERHFSGLVASLGLFEVGMLPFPGIEPQTRVLDRPGAAEVAAHAVRRGAACSGDFSEIDHFALADESLEEVRRELEIPPRIC
jgi:hypothetical protein